MHYSLSELESSFQLSVFGAAIERLPALMAVREFPGGSLVYVNPRGVTMLGGDTPEALEAIMTRNSMGTGEITGKAPGGVLKWQNAAGEIMYGHYEEAPMQYNGKEYRLVRLSDSMPDVSYQQIQRQELEQKVQERTMQLMGALDELQLSKDDLSRALGKEKELGELKSRFVSMASHEFRTPLSTILSSAYLAKQYNSEADETKRHKHIQRIVSSVNFLTDILNDFLSLGKIEEGKIQVRPILFDVREHVQNMLQETQGIVKENQTIDYKHEGWPDVMLDPSLLRHIVLNLVGNAIKFSVKANSVISVTTRTDSYGLRLEVKDNGIGMSPEDQQHLFERFFRGANVTNIQGTGLGLHIVSKYTELMNGVITCKSELGKGTAFTILFPPVTE